jgi:hypothetical protein
MGCVGPFCVVIEIKTDTGKLSAMQAYKRKKIMDCGSIAMVVTPSNMLASLKFLENLSKKCSNFSHTEGDINDQIKL